MRKKNLTTKKKIKIVDAVAIRQRRDVLYFKNKILPKLENLWLKLVEVVPWFFVYFFILRLFGYSMTGMNFASGVALYFFIEEFKEFYLRIKLIKGKK